MLHPIQSNHRMPGQRNTKPAIRSVVPGPVHSWRIVLDSALLVVLDLQTGGICRSEPHFLLMNGLIRSPAPNPEEWMSKELTILVSVMTVALFACSGESAPAGPASTVSVDLVDIDANTMQMTLDAQSVPQGEITFEVTNSGDLLHEFVVFKTDLAIDDLPTNESGSEVIEDGPGLTLIDEIEDIQVGETKTLTVGLEAGNYALVCNIKGHYQKGLSSAFTVTQP